MKRRWITGFFILAVLVSLAACQSAEETKNVKKQPEKPAETEQKPPPKKKPEPEDIYPLTGKPADHHVENRPFGVMINNAPKARPQSGVYKADIVYEVLAEGAITRFLALFQSQQPEIIGPVRSARPYFVKLNNAYDAIYVHHGWSPQARELIKSTDTDNINGLYYDGTLFHRVDFRNAPHNSYIPYENIIKGAKENDYPLKADIDPLPFLDPEEASSLTGEKATEVTIDYLDRYQVRFVYQPDTETYLRYSEGEKSIDRETKTPITVANVFIVAAPHRYIDSYPRRGINLQDGGKAMLFQKGTVRKLKWKNVEGRIVPVHNGKTVGFVPGQTWVNIIPADPGLAGSVKVTGRDENAN